MSLHSNSRNEQNLIFLDAGATPDEMVTYRKPRSIWEAAAWLAVCVILAAGLALWFVFAVKL
jgi:hypothetical protein